MNDIETVGANPSVSVVVYNNGILPLTSVNVIIDINGTTTNEPWSGNIDSKKTDTVNLGAINLVAASWYDRSLQRYYIEFAS